MTRDLLIVGRDTEERKRIKHLLDGMDMGIRECADPVNALQEIQQTDFSMVIISTPGDRLQGLQLKKNIQLQKPGTDVILFNNFKNIRTSEDVLRHGGADYIIEMEDLRRFIIQCTREKPSAAPEEPEAGKVKNFFIHLTDLLISILEINDKFFSGNTHNVMKLSRHIAKMMDLDPELVDAITLGSLLRDLGKIGVKQQILNQTRELTDNEFSLIKDHCQTSLKLLKRLDLPWRVDQIILSHHENYDGSGYPSGLKGREIPLGARVLSVVESFVAITTDRPHRKALDMNAAIKEIQQLAGTRYDPEVVEVFLKVIQKDWKWNAHKKERLLIVDDEKYMQTLIKLHMVNEGFEVITADNGAEAMTCIKKKKPDLILSDVMMPLMDGFTFCRMVTKNPKTRDVPFVFLSSCSNPDDRVQGLKLGAIDYISKPFDLEELSLKINTILKREKRNRKVPESESGIKGRLEDMSITDIVQILSLGLKTARVEVYPETEEPQGFLFFSRGEITFAATNKLEGKEAFYQMLHWNEGKFKIRHGMQPNTVNISNNTMGLLMEGMKLLDEENQKKNKSASQ